MHTMTEELVSERARRLMEQARRSRCSRRVRALRRADRIEHRAERRLIEAWRRAARLRAAAGFADY